ncbi:hypothetical protein F4778DRAFT_705376 [Xylariomycetidae sp. FL2044]|nr:hypothetical protein F4778DRAFT_705376 [Xylariomycetidae sp. FL2044]
MRPPRIVILTLFFAACLFLLCRAITSIGRPAPVLSSPQSTQKSGFRSLFSFSGPFTLFPPNAIITIADDNSTSFAARPAAFGPPLPTKGLNGKLWIGSGFTEETLQDGEGEGELGCSDVPGWDDGTSKAVLKVSMKEIKGNSKSAASAVKSNNQKRDVTEVPLVARNAGATAKPNSKNHAVNDGTDDYLHQGLDQSQKTQSDDLGSGSGHADIQSIQEGAEIAGKIVLLSRGGCGFLEKVKWAQRRGAIALIVGDNQRGEPLIQMYAHGDTSNVTIPSIFTSRTTAYLLSLMMQPGSFIEDLIDENGNPSLKVQQSDKGRKNQKARQAAAINQPRHVSGDAKNGKLPKVQKQATTKATDKPESSPSWLSRAFSWGSSSSATSKSRASSSGQLDWVLVEDFSDEKDKMIKNSLNKASKGSAAKGASNSGSRETPGDNFQIGVEDWRDPDLLGSDDADEAGGAGKLAKAKQSAKTGKQATKQQSPKGTKGSTSSSGEHGATHVAVDGQDAKSSKEKTSNGNGSLISKLFGQNDETSNSKVESQPKPIETPIIGRPGPGDLPPSPPPEEREGLWVVITPSSGASPFFDTLLVLVISPLITLTVVYALLILRAKIRRRRWRAPKSVVERLPVRTYHTVASTPSHTSRLPSPTSSSPTTPLLQSQNVPARPRPRSRTTTGVPSAGDLLEVGSSLSLPRSPSRSEHEKRNSPSQWKKYMGRQVECVVCLEEYVDGVSQVMSLPCGHEFHVDCITPWLTTRRRTCPICKGDVVRSLARGSPSSPRYEPYRDDSDDDMMLAAASSSSNNAPRGNDDDGDIEQGIPSSPHRAGHSNWFSMLSSSVRDRFASRADDEQPSNEEHRDR